MVWPPKTFGLGEVNKQTATPSQKSIHNTEEVFFQLGYVLAEPPAALTDSRKYFFQCPTQQELNARDAPPRAHFWTKKTYKKSQKL